MYALYKSFVMVNIYLYTAVPAHTNVNFSIAFFLSSKGGESKSSEPVTPTTTASTSGAGTGSVAYVMPSIENTRIRSIKVNSSGTMVALLTGKMRCSIVYFCIVLFCFSLI